MQWLNCNRLALNITKTNFVIFSSVNKPLKNVTILLGNKAIKEVFNENIPQISSTKSLTGHSLGATSVQEAIYCLIMMQNKFISASANIENMDEKAKEFPIVTKVVRDKEINCVMSNSFGFGGTNATLVFEKLN